MKQLRFPELNAETMSPRQKEIVEKIASGPRGGVRGPFLALVHHPDLADVVQQVGEHLRFKATLPASLIELAILVVARHWTCQFEWYAHDRFARANTDLPDAIIRAIQVGAVPEDMTDDQRIVYDFVVRTIRSGTPSDVIYDEAAERFGKQGVLDLIVTCGYYSTLAMLLNTAQIGLPDGVSPPLRELLQSA